MYQRNQRFKFSVSETHRCFMPRAFYMTATTTCDLTTVYA